MQNWKRFLFENIEKVIHFLSPSDAFLTKYIVNYMISSHNFQGKPITDPDIDLRCISSLVKYREYKIALKIANNLGNYKAIALILPYIPMNDVNFLLVEKSIGQYKELLGFWYLVFYIDLELCIL